MRCQGERLAYVAGIVDGEGCITFSVDKSKRQKSIHPRLDVGNNSIEVLTLCQETLGGGKVYNGVSPTKHYACQSSKALLEALEALLPFLVVKRKQAELMLEYLKNHHLNAQGCTKRELEIVNHVRMLNGNQVELSEKDVHIREDYKPWDKGLKGIHLCPQNEFKKGHVPWNKGVKHGTLSSPSRLGTA